MIEVVLPHIRVESSLTTAQHFGLFSAITILILKHFKKRLFFFYFHQKSCIIDLATPIGGCLVPIKEELFCLTRNQNVFSVSTNFKFVVDQPENVCYSSLSLMSAIVFKLDKYFSYMFSI